MRPSLPIPACTVLIPHRSRPLLPPGPEGEPPAMSREAFMARARALLLNVGVIRHNRGTIAGGGQGCMAAAHAASCLLLELNARPLPKALPTLFARCASKLQHAAVRLGHQPPVPGYPGKATQRPDPFFTFLPSSTAAASQLGQFLARPDGAPASVGRIAEADMADVPRFLNRCACCKVFQLLMLSAGWASPRQAWPTCRASSTGAVVLRCFSC